jgi:hypothetical protein
VKLPVIVPDEMEHDAAVKRPDGEDDSVHEVPE